MWGSFEGAGESVFGPRSDDYRWGFTFKFRLFGVMFEVEPDDLGRFYDERWKTTRVFRDQAEEYEAVRAAFVPLPWIRCYSREVSGPMSGVGVPVLKGRLSVALLEIAFHVRHD